MTDEQLLKAIQKTVTESLKDQFSVINDKLDELKKTQDEHTEIFDTQVLPSVTYIENNIKGYSDMYKMNNSNIKKLDKRVNILEEELSIETPKELILGEVR